MRAASKADLKRVFIGGVGYTNLRDLSVGPLVVPELAHETWPDGVEIDDLSIGGPISAVLRFGEALPYDRVVLFGGVGRGRKPGQVYAYRWDGVLPDSDEIQGCVTEAVTGIISIDNLLIVGGHFGIWPADTIVVEVEPREDDWGPQMSETVRAALPVLRAALHRIATTTDLRLPAQSDVAWCDEATQRERSQSIS